MRDGVHSLTARATDNDGDTTVSSAVTLTVSPATVADAVAPVVQLTAPAALSTGLSGRVLVQASATDNVGVQSVEFEVDGESLGAPDTSAPYEATWDSSTAPSGPHVLRARARDAAGNLSSWASTTVSTRGSSASTPLGFIRDEQWLTGLQDATAFAQSPDGRFFVAERGGRIRIVRDGTITGTFLTLSVDNSGERGLLGLTLHPQFPSTAWVYVHYTRPQGRVHNRVSRYRASGDLASGSEDSLIELPNLSSSTDRNGGPLRFGADGKLYVGVGDGGNTSLAATAGSLFGKLLRLDADGSLPSDNPHYTTQRGTARAVWASGLRDPAAIAVQPGTGRLQVHDRGASRWEEINLGTAGANYGWPTAEGPDSSAGLSPPMFAYGHAAASDNPSLLTGQAIAGGVFVPTDSTRFPARYRGHYLFADQSARWLARIDPASPNVAYAFATLTDSPVDMLIGQDGALYVLTRQGITRIAATP